MRRKGWLEALICFAVYQTYSFLRIQVRGDPGPAFDNAKELIGLEKVLHIWNEEGFQDVFLDWDGFLRFWNVFHGSAHFVVPPLVLVYLWRRHRHRYRMWRNVFGWTLVFGLLGFALYPVTPPRLLPPSYGFEDTGATVGGLGFIGKSQPIDEGNAFAEIPSLHVAFAFWAALALRSRWALLYPAAMAFSTIVTGKHYWLDAGAGVVVVLLGWAIEMRRAGTPATTE